MSSISVAKHRKGSSNGWSFFLQKDSNESVVNDSPVDCQSRLRLLRRAGRIPIPLQKSKSLAWIFFVCAEIRNDVAR